MTPATSFDLTGRTALVTGGGRDIGAAVARELGRHGARVVINYHSSGSAAEALADRLRSEGKAACAVRADVRDPDEVKRLVREAARFGGGRIDILVNNAGGLIERRAFEAVDAAFWRATFLLNAESVFACCRAVWAMMRDAGRGSIVNVTSIAARNGGSADSIVYAAAKGAVSTFTRGLARAGAPHGIRVNGVAPGLIDTAFHKVHTPRDRFAAMSAQIPLGRPGEADDVGATVVYLASDASRYVTGEIVEVNGGLLMD